ncbi:MAG TPA: cellulose synthase subunit BcsC-related outer membrane protein, partial [Candidatus Sulfopaludibacter sp.]|nr:cellulose synthase subunit BcsC-related outer membrane protein [Candidatus Sulfopaludibacter sp.]
DILEAAARAFPENITVRKVLAGGYVRTGQVKEALAMYKSVGMQDASASDFQGAIGAALAANDKALAETWLRQGLERYPNDPSVLAMAARFEQARGDNQRAADYWRASIAAMPQPSATDTLAHQLAYPDVSNKPHTARTNAELQDLLNPNSEPFAKTTKLPPLPAYGPDPYLGRAPVVVTPAQPGAQPQPPMVTAPATTQVPLETPPATRSTSTPLPVPMARAPDPTQPNAQPAANPGTTSPTKRTRSSSANHPSPAPPSYSGRMNLPPSEENITTTEPSQPAQAQPRENPVYIPPPPSETNPVPQTQAPPQLQSSIPAPDSGAYPPQRIASQPMDAKAAQAQALFAEQTDGQLTQGSASQIHSLANAPVTLPSSPVHPALDSNGRPVTSPAATYNAAQYTPSAQEAATGAYSAQKPQPQQGPVQAAPAVTPPPQTLSPQQPVTPAPAEQTGKKSKPRARTQTVPTLVTAPGEQSPSQVTVPPTTTQENPQAPVPGNPGSFGTDGATDEELQQQNLPPLRGPWVRVQRQQRVISPREEAEAQLQSLESSYSPWMGATGVINYRSGSLGYDHLAALEAPFEISTPFGYNARLTVIAKTAFLDSGQADGTSVITVQEATTSGTCLVTISQPLGTLINTGPAGAASTCGTTATTGTFTAPPQQNAAGVGGEVQLSFPHLALAAGYTPYGLLVSNFTGRAQWRPGNG